MAISPERGNLQDLGTDWSKNSKPVLDSQPLVRVICPLVVCSAAPENGHHGGQIEQGSKLVDDGIERVTASPSVTVPFFPSPGGREVVRARRGPAAVRSLACLMRQAGTPEEATSGSTLLDVCRNSLRLEVRVWEGRCDEGRMHV